MHVLRNFRVFLRPCPAGGSALVTGSRCALAMCVHPAYFDLATPLSKHFEQVLAGYGRLTGLNFAITKTLIGPPLSIF